MIYRKFTLCHLYWTAQQVKFRLFLLQKILNEKLGSGVFQVPLLLLLLEANVPQPQQQPAIHFQGSISLLSPTKQQL